MRTHLFERREKRWSRNCIVVLIAMSCVATTAFAQQKPSPDAANASIALTAALSAACKEDAATFATYLTSENSTAFQGLVVPNKSPS